MEVIGREVESREKVFVGQGCQASLHRAYNSNQTGVILRVSARPCVK